MEYMKKFFRLPELYVVLLLAACLVVGLMFRITIENVTLYQDDARENLSLPILKDMDDGMLFQVELDVVGAHGRAYDLKVIPDDCVSKVEVDGHSVDLDSFPGHCDYTRGFVLKDSVIALYRMGGPTHFVFHMRNKGGPGGLNVFVERPPFLVRSMNVAAVILFAFLCMLVARRLGLGWEIATIVLMGALLRGVFFVNIPYTMFTYDVDGHVSYVQHILQKHEIPKAEDCWSCYHPPVYYVASAPSFLIGDWLGITGTTGMQAFSLLLSVVTLFFGLLFFKQIFSGIPFCIASVLWTFWPVMIMAAPRIGNDQMFCLFHVLCLWGGIKYLNSGRGKYLIFAVVASALAMWSKTTAVITLGVLFLFTVAGYVGNARLLKPSRSERVAWLLFFTLVLAIMLQKLLGNGDLVANAGGLNSKLRVGNEAFNYLYFDLRSFLEHPFTSAWNDADGRQFFWNYTLKTSLFGEFNMVHHQVGRTWATVSSVSMLGLVVYAMRGIWKSRINMVNSILVLQAVAFIAALMSLRIKYPFACSNDFRLIMPVLLSFIPFVVSGVTLKEASVKWRALGYGLVLMFVASSTVLYILAM